jgi:cytochrome c6
MRVGLLPIAAGAVLVVAGAAACGGSGQKKEGDPVAGKRIFVSAGCGQCHALAAAGTRGIIGGPLDGIPHRFDDVVARVRDGGGGMPSFLKKLSPAEIDDVAAFVATAAKH